MDEYDDQALVDVLAGRICYGQSFEEVLAEQHARLIAMSKEDLEKLKKLAEERAGQFAK